MAQKDHPMKTQYLFFNAEVNEKSTNAFASAVTDGINDPTIDEIYVGFCSCGGQVSYGIGAHHFLKSSPKPITMHAIGAVNSIALCIFMGATKRYASTGSSFQFHGVARYLNAGNYASPVLRDILSNLTRDETVLTQVWQGHMKIDSAEATALFQSEHMHDCKWAIEHGLIEDIRDFILPRTAVGNVRNIIT